MLGRQHQWVWRRRTGKQSESKEGAAPDLTRDFRPWTQELLTGKLSVMSPVRESLGSARAPSRSLRQVLPEARHDTSDLQESAADGGGHEGVEQPTLVGTKLRPPPVREQSIPRERLLERLRSGSDRRLTLVACPAGFGKTTLLSAWYEAEATRRTRCVADAGRGRQRSGGLVVACDRGARPREP